MSTTGLSKSLEVQWGERVRKLRKARGWTQEQFAALVIVRQSYISKVETGVTNPTDAMKVRLAAALGEPVHKVFPWPGQESAA